MTIRPNQEEASRHTLATSVSTNICETAHAERRLLILLLVVTTTPTGSRHPLALDATRAASAKGRVERKVNVLLALGTDEERRHIHDLLADADVALANEHASVVHRLGEAKLEHKSLQAALKEGLSVERKNVIELVLGLVLLQRGGGCKRGCQRCQQFYLILPYDISQGPCGAKVAMIGLGNSAFPGALARNRILGLRLLRPPTFPAVFPRP